MPVDLLEQRETNTYNIPRFRKSLRYSIACTSHCEGWKDGCRGVHSQPQLDATLQLVTQVLEHASTSGQIFQRSQCGIRTSLKADIQCSAAELVNGTTLRLPGEFSTPRSRPNFGKSDYVHRLSAFIRLLSSVSTRIQHRQVALPRELSTCSHVFIRVDSVRKPLEQPCEGPFHVIARHEKTFKVDRHGRVEIVSVDRLKPAHVDDSALSDNLRFNARPIKPIGILKSSSDPTLDTSETSFSCPG
ncbi:unnamed protein product [Schistosoma curassoni]|uniref:Uncharacterized protein n=1 Tax=Schistosoma curassoni TaxID=6186 RepID=A0A183JWX1_9TREM|nr:unnamed protein product [Schistosoma curassoni]